MGWADDHIEMSNWHSANGFVTYCLLSDFVILLTIVFSRLILIAEKDTVYEAFPTPLINRLEKHFVLTSSILESWQEGVLSEFEDWINRFSSTGYNIPK